MLGTCRVRTSLCAATTIRRTASVCTHTPGSHMEYGSAMIVHVDPLTLEQSNMPPREHKLVKYSILYPHRTHNSKIVGWVKGSLHIRSGPRKCTCKRWALPPCIHHPALHSNLVKELQKDDYTDEVLLDPIQLIENPDFETFLQHVLSEHIYHCPENIKTATQLGSGWMNIYDKRAKYNRSVPSEDTLGSVELREGKMVPNSYTPMPTHRLLSEFGELFKLTDFMKEKFEYELQREQKMEHSRE